MTSQHTVRPSGAGAPHPPPKVRGPRFPRLRPFTWFILAVNVGMLVWAVWGASQGKSCHGLTGTALTDCQAGDVGTGIGVGLIILIWALVDIILGVLWLVTKPRTRDCPACGNKVRRGVTQCRYCGFDLVAHAQGTPPGPDRGPRWGPR